MTITPLPADVVCQLRRVLDSIGDALVDGRSEPLLTAERDLGPALSAVASLDRSSPLAPQTRTALRHEISRCLAALERCRRLGLALDHFVAFMLQQIGHAGAYTRTGDTAVLAPSGRLEARG